MIKAILRQKDARASRNDGADEVWPSFDWWVAIRFVLYAFVLSRGLIVFASAMTYAFTTQWPLHLSFQTMQLFTPDFFEHAKSMILQDDAGWYLGVAEQGYEARPFDVSKPSNWAFFPMHPWIWRGLIALGLSPWLAGLLLANVLFFLALLCVHRWVSTLADIPTAQRSVMCIALFPTAYFFAMPFSEPLYIFLLASCLLSMQQKNWLTAAVFAGFASGARVIGIFLAPLMWWQARADHSWFTRSALAAMGGIGLLAFMLTLWLKTGDPLAFAHIQTAWGRNGPDLVKPLQDWVTNPSSFAESWNVIWINVPALLLGLCAAGWLWYRRFHAFAVFTLACMLLPWSSGAMMGMARYVNVCIPVFFALASWLSRPYFYLTWLIISACLLVWMAGSFTLGATFSGA